MIPNLPPSRAIPGEHAAGPPSPTARPRPAVPSAQLLRGQNTVLIEHRGAVYELRETRLGKLILTK